VDALVAGTGITLNPANGQGTVTISSSGADPADPYNQGIVYAYANSSSSLTNTMLGYRAFGEGISLGGGGNNIAVGQYSMSGASSASASNIAIGNAALRSSGLAAARNIAVGSAAVLQGGQDNVGVGHQTLYNTVGANNIAIGTNAGYNITSGNSNILIGASSGSNVSSGSNNTIIGTYTHNGTPLNNSVLIFAGNDCRFTSNPGGAISFDGSSYGALGQVLTSSGTSSRPSWQYPDTSYYLRAYTPQQALYFGSLVGFANQLTPTVGNLPVYIYGSLNDQIFFRKGTYSISVSYEVGYFANASSGVAEYVGRSLLEFRISGTNTNGIPNFRVGVQLGLPSNQPVPPIPSSGTVVWNFANDTTLVLKQIIVVGNTNIYSVATNINLSVVRLD
jgi:hypothetical protein